MWDNEQDDGAAGVRAVLDEARAIKRRWSEGAPADARAALASHPDLSQHKSVVLDLAYEEFCRRRAAGEAVDADEFCDQFPAHRSSVRHLVEMADWVDGLQDLIPPETAVVWPEPGETFGDYTLLRELGAGAFARVYLAREGATGDRPVVLKVSLHDNAEARTLGRLDDDNIVPVLWAGRHESGLSLVCMPFLGSATLHHVLDTAYPQRDAPPPRQSRVLLEAVRAAVQPGDPPLKLSEPAACLTRGSWVNAVTHVGERLASALAVVHAHGVCHRDLKPSNVLLDAAGRPRLLDFNLSEDERLERKPVGGTLPYMAPEQLRFCLPSAEGCPQPDGRADLYALGVILYELLTGRLPFQPASTPLARDEQATWLLERQKQGLVPLRRRNRDVSRRLAALIESCLAFDAQDRPASAKELAEALRRLLAPRRVGRLLACTLGVLLATGGGSALYSYAVQVPAKAKHAAAEEYRAGCQAFDAGNLDDADEHFMQATLKNPKHAPSWFARGRTLLARNKVENAMVMFGKAADCFENDKIPGEISAARAYCFLLLKRFGEAHFYSSQAKKVGIDSIQALNNHAYACFKNSQPKEAKATLDQVFKEKKGDEYLPAHYNRATLLYQEWVVAQGPYKKDVMLPLEARDDIDAVVKEHGDVAAVHADAAYIYAALSASQPELLLGVRYHLTAAVSFGWNKKMLEKHLGLQMPSVKQTVKETLTGLVPGPYQPDPDAVELHTENPIRGWLAE